MHPRSVAKAQDSAANAVNCPDDADALFQTKESLKLKAVFPNTIDLEKKLHPLSLLNNHVSCFAPSTRKTEGERDLKRSKVSVSQSSSG
jgi:hypothetical protein